MAAAMPRNGAVTRHDLLDRIAASSARAASSIPALPLAIVSPRNTSPSSASVIRPLAPGRQSRNAAASADMAFCTGGAGQFRRETDRTAHQA